MNYCFVLEIIFTIYRYYFPLYLFQKPNNFYPSMVYSQPISHSHLQLWVDYLKVTILGAQINSIQLCQFSLYKISFGLKYLYCFLPFSLKQSGPVHLRGSFLIELLFALQALLINQQFYCRYFFMSSVDDLVSELFNAVFHSALRDYCKFQGQIDDERIPR